MDKSKLEMKIEVKKPRNYIALQMVLAGKAGTRIMKDRRKSRETKKDWRKEQW